MVAIVGPMWRRPTFFRIRSDLIRPNPTNGEFFLCKAQIKA